MSFAPVPLNLTPSRVGGKSAPSEFERLWYRPNEETYRERSGLTEFFIAEKPGRV